MTMALSRLIPLTLAGAILLTSPGAARQVRDQAAPSASIGTGLLAGTVVTDDAPARPLRRATVTLSEAGTAIVGRMATTDDMGRYMFGGLPAGKYTITASRPPYLRGSYGAHRMVSPSTVVVGTTIPLTRGQQLTGLTIFMQPGAAISGMVRDAEGQPAGGVSINVWYYQWVSGVRTLVSAGGFSTTDDRGVYRIYGLAPGEYTIAVIPRGSGQMDLLTWTDAELRRAMDLIQRPSGSNAPPAAGPAAQTVGWAPVFYPSVTELSQASPIRVAVGEDRGGVDIQLQLIQTSRIEGTVIGRDGAPAPNQQVQLVSANFETMQDMGASQSAQTSTDRLGRFVLSGLAPGLYSVQAGLYGAPPMFGATDVVLQGQVANVTISLLPLPSVAGRVVFEGASAPPEMSKIHVAISRLVSKPQYFSGDAVPQVNGEFSIASVLPDRYRFAVTQSATAGATPWILKSVTANGQDVTDRPLEIRPGVGTSIVATLTDRTTELSGRLSDAANAGVSDFYVVAFPAGQAAWTPTTRRIQITRPEQDGRFVFQNLPPGDYRIAAITDVQQGEWLNPDFLAQLVDASIKVVLPEGGKVVQDMRIK